MGIRITLCFLVGSAFLLSCNRKMVHLEKTMAGDPFLSSVAYDSVYEVQIIYTRVDQKKKKFHSQYFRVNENNYFYPASTVKMPVAILALQKIHALRQEGVTLFPSDAMLTAQGNERLTAAFSDPTQDSGKPSIERYIQKIFAVSDNDAYNRLFEFLGRDYINDELRKKGMQGGTFIRHRLSIPGLSEEDNATYNNIRFFREKQVVYDQPMTRAKHDWKHAAAQSMKGRGYIDQNDSLVLAPFDFGNKNFYSLRDMEGTLQRILVPDYFPPASRFDLHRDDYHFLRKCMSDLPSAYSFYSDSTVYYDSYVKYFLFGDSKERIPSHIKIYNKVGTAYGFLIDCAYIEDTQHDIGFFLTAVIHVNTDGIYNDNRYDYDTVGIPFLARLGRAIYAAELATSKKAK